MHVHAEAATVISHFLADPSEKSAARLIDEAPLPEDAKLPLALMPFSKAGVKSGGRSAS